MKSVKAKKNVRKKQPEGRDKIEVEPGENLNVDKTAKTFSDFQKQRQSKSSRFINTVKRPHHVQRMGVMSVRKKKI